MKYEVVKIGTDIYLEWDNMTKKDKDLRVTGFDISKGNNGYLRASIGMTEENAVLRMLFPDTMWKAQKAVAYDFKQNISFLPSLVKGYIEGQDFDVQDRMKEQTEFGAGINEMLKLAGMTKIQTNDDSFESTWAKSLVAFFIYGMELQKAGKNPKIYISW